MRDWARREFLRSIAATTAAWLDPSMVLASNLKSVKITDLDIFAIDIPVSATEHAAGFDHRFTVVRIDTDAGIRGYSFAGPSPQELPRIRQLLIGQDLFAIERHLSQGLIRWGGVEHALWDAIGKVTGQPVYRLLGGRQVRVKAYVTCVWPGNADQSHVTYQAQAQMAKKLQSAGYRGMKIRAWRPRPMDDVATARVIKEEVGHDFALMFDRTADKPSVVGQPVWNYETGRDVARGLQDLGVAWLEEPFARDNYLSPARLAAEMEMPITGGEGYVGLDGFRECALHKSYDILQPEGMGVGGIFTCLKVASIAQAFKLPCILHGSMSLRVAGWIQASLAIGSEWQELALITPPLLPEEQWSPGSKVLKNSQVFSLQDGYIIAPDVPGIGLDVDEMAIQQFRVRT